MSPEGVPSLLALIRMPNPGGALRALERGDSAVGSEGDPDVPLVEAAKRGLLCVMRALLDKGALIDQPDAAGQTPLMVAVQYGQVNSAKLLLEHGADVNVAMQHGYQAMDAAITRGDSRLVQLLLQQDYLAVDLNRYLGFAVLQGYAGVVRLLLEYGADPNYSGGTGYAPLLLAVANARTRIVRLLLEHNAATNVTDKSGRTLKQIARHTRSRTILRLLEGRSESG